MTEQHTDVFTLYPTGSQFAALCFSPAQATVIRFSGQSLEVMDWFSKLNERLRPPPLHDWRFDTLVRWP